MTMTKTNRNDPCPCGSGKKYKKCCGAEVTVPRAPAFDPFSTMNDSAWRLVEAGNYAAASGACNGVLRLAPGNLSALHIKAVAESLLGNLESARALCQRVVDAAPQDSNYLNTFGNIILTAGELVPAIEAFRRVVSLKPGFAHAHFNLGLALSRVGRPDEAFSCYQEAVRLDPDHAPARHNLALHLLQQGDFERGWVEHEWRWRTPSLASQRRDFPQPHWQGEAIPGKTILLHAEQGAGDTIQFVRYAPLVLARGARVIVECQPELVSLFSHSMPDVTVIGKDGTLPEFDCHCPMMSLPLAMATRLENLPATTPYLSAEPDAMDGWRSRFSGASLNVGVVWRGNPSYLNDKQRSVDAQLLEPLADIPGVRLVSLQKGGPITGASSLLLARCDDAAPDLTNYAATAAAIMALDLVISVDTAVAHLAGALGKPVWVLLPNPSDWRWGFEGETSPWYPTMRLFRQKVPGQWNEVFQAVSASLQACVGHKSVG
jgi:hypothetical protein